MLKSHEGMTTGTVLVVLVVLLLVHQGSCIHYHHHHQHEEHHTEKHHPEDHNPEEHHHHHHRHMSSWNCYRCPPGWGVVGVCNRTDDTRCAPCTANSTYSPHHSYLHPCAPCSRCGPGLYEAHPCTQTHDTICDSCTTFRGPHNDDFGHKCHDDSSAPDDVTRSNEKDEEKEEEGVLAQLTSLMSRWGAEDEKEDVIPTPLALMGPRNDTMTTRKGGNSGFEKRMAGWHTLNASNTLQVTVTVVVTCVALLSVLWLVVNCRKASNWVDYDSLVSQEFV